MMHFSFDPATIASFAKGRSVYRCKILGIFSICSSSPSPPSPSTLFLLFLLFLIFLLRPQEFSHLLFLFRFFPAHVLLFCRAQCGPSLCIFHCEQLWRFFDLFR
eukprot:TRINITY_DN10944_c0_g1_i10.p1 TRINITY_DN10944_c0_g1~~TRINITY_DN10944_c0_g1_i10.p1  ORF type:complete len:104 (-),score=8.59 TRINITY_DN10944_c0_g1_i10:92-403(-)